MHMTSEQPMTNKDLPANYDKYTKEEREFYHRKGAKPGERVILTKEEVEMLQRIADKEGIRRPKKEGPPKEPRLEESPEKKRDRMVLNAALAELRSEHSARNDRLRSATSSLSSRRGIWENRVFTPFDTIKYTPKQIESEEATLAKNLKGQMVIIGALEALKQNKPLPSGTKEALQMVEEIYAEDVRTQHEGAKENPSEQSPNNKHQKSLQEVADLIHRLNG
jgi:hypothetical protein